MHDYHKLVVWKESVELVKLTYRLTSHFPQSEIYGLTSQLKRAVVSVLANIVEGRGKPTDKDFLKFLYISRGSLDECACYYELSLELGFINKDQFDYIDKKRNQVSFLLFKLITSIEISTKKD